MHARLLIVTVMQGAFYFEAGYLNFYQGQRNRNHVTIGVPINLVVGQKYRVSVERDGLGVWRMYINGTPYSPSVVTANARTFNPHGSVWANTPLYVGCLWPGMVPFYGHIDELRVTIGEARGKGAIMVDNGRPFPDR